MVGQRDCPSGLAGTWELGGAWLGQLDRGLVLTRPHVGWGLGRWQGLEERAWLPSPRAALHMCSGLSLRSGHCRLPASAL